LEVELKFGRSFEIESFHRLLITSNHTQVVQASSEARRFVVCNVSDARRGDSNYFDRLYAVADGRDVATAQALMHHLLNRDLSKFQPWAAQQRFLDDKALIEQKRLSLSPPLAWLLELLEKMEASSTPQTHTRSDHWSGGFPIGDWPATFPRAVAIQQFREWTAIAKPHGAATFTGSSQRFWTEITRVIPRHLTQVKDANGNRSVSISLHDLRMSFDAYMQGK
jgi:hypothetical protein